MDGRIDYSRYTEAELLEALDAIDRDRFPENFKRLIAALDACRAASAASATAQSVTRAAPIEGIPDAFPEPFPVKLSPGRGPFGWIEPARNNFHLVGRGSLWLGQDFIQVSGHRFLLWLGLPWVRSIQLERRFIVNVETESNALRLEYRARDCKPKALTVWFDDELTAARVAAALPGERTTDFQPQLHKELDFEAQLRSRSKHTPVTATLLALNALVFIAGAASGDFPLFAPEEGDYVSWGSTYGPYTTAGDWWRLLTGQFLHFGIVHLLCNVWALGAFGPITERLLGSTAYAFVYVFAGLAASTASISWEPAMNSVGASGAIFGIYGALVASLLGANRAIAGSLLKSLRNSTLIFTAYALCGGLFVDGIDNAAHLGGLVSGFTMGLAHSIGSRCRRFERIPETVAASAIALAGIFAVGVGIAAARQRADVLAGEDLYHHTQRWLVRNEHLAIARHKIILEQVQNGHMDDAGFARAIENSVLPIWMEAESRLQAIALPPDSQFQTRLQYLRDLVSSRRTALGLCTAGIRMHSKAMIDRCDAELERGNRMVQDRKERRADEQE